MGVIFSKFFPKSLQSAGLHERVLIQSLSASHSMLQFSIDNLMSKGPAKSPCPYDNSDLAKSTTSPSMPTSHFIDSAAKSFRLIKKIKVPLPIISNSADYAKLCNILIYGGFNYFHRFAVIFTMWIYGNWKVLFSLACH